MSTDLETRVRDLMHSVDVQPPLLDPSGVVGRGRRIRTLRRRRRGGAAVLGVVIAAYGLAWATVPATGHPLTPLVWAAGPTPTGPAESTWMSVGGQRYQASIRETRLDHRTSWVTSRVLPDGHLKDMAGSSVEVT